jgi:signal recognition particle GTPase
VNRKPRSIQTTTLHSEDTGTRDIESLVESVQRMQVEFTEEDVKKIIEGEINMKIIYKQLISRSGVCISCNHL